MNIYVSNLPRSTDEDAVKELFEAHGTVDQVKLIKDRDTGELRGFGFVEMPVKAEGEAAIAGVDGAELEGRKLIVNEARPRRNDGGGRGGGRRHGGGGGGGGGGGDRSWLFHSPVSEKFKNKNAPFRNSERGVFLSGHQNEIFLQPIGRSCAFKTFPKRRQGEVAIPALPSSPFRPCNLAFYAAEHTCGAQ